MSWVSRLCLAVFLAAGAGSAGFSAPPFPVPAGQSFRDAPWAPELVVTPLGAAIMGASAEETQREGKSAAAAAWEQPVHTIRVSIPLAIGKFVVTHAEFKRFLDATGVKMTGGCMVDEGGQWILDPAKSFSDPAFPVTDRHPATCVHWGDAQAYVNWLSAATGHKYRLLHEAEWEYAARAGTTTSRWWGDRRDGLCGYLNGADRSYSRAYPAEVRVDKTCDDGYVQTSPVDAFPPNPFGLYDMYGNVEEWLADCSTESYTNAPSEAEAEVAGDCAKISVRGGTWHSDAPLFRSANRGFLPPTMRASSVGFRVVRLPD